MAITSTSFLTKGSQVEVSSHEADSNDAWYSATVINAPPSTTSLNHTSSNSLVYVEYHNLLSEDGSSSRLREYANIAHVRPAPVSDTGPIDFRLNDLVDAFYRDGWWTGVITTVVDASNFAVTFQNRIDEIQFRCEDLRIHKEWIGGRWFQPQKQDDMALRTTDNQIEQAAPGTSKGSPAATSIMKRKRQDLDNNDKASTSNDIMKVDSGEKNKNLSDGQSKGFDSEVNGMTNQASSKTVTFSHEKKVETKNRRECTNDAIAAMPISWWLPKDGFGAVEGDTDVGTTDSLIDNQIEQATPIIGKQSPVATSIMEEKTQDNTDSNDAASPSVEIVNADLSTNKKQPTDGQSEDLDFKMTDQEKGEKSTEMKASTKGSKRKKGGLNKELKSLQASKEEVYLFRTRTQEIVAKKDATKNFPLDEKSSSVAKSDKKQPDVPLAPLTVVDQTMADQAPLKFVDSHNIVGYLLDPPQLHKEFKSMIVGLNTCRISHAIRETPVIRKDLITDFWNKASYNRWGAGGVGTIESTVKNKQIIISEEIIREVLLFGDHPEYPTEFATNDVIGVLLRMGYEGSYPPTIKKLLPPYWRFLAHTFVSCVSGRKGGTDEISQASTSAIVALIMDWDYNFSKYVFDEMVSNLTRKKKDLFLMYPRFLQMIFDAKYPELERSLDTLDVKALGPNAFGLIKQTRQATKVAYKGLQKLVKFGKFAETEDVQDVNVVNAEVAEEHVASIAFEEVFDDETEVPSQQPLEETHNEVVQNLVPTPDQMAAIKEQLQRTALKPPQSVPATLDQPSASDQEESDTASMPRKRRRMDPITGDLIQEPVQVDTPTVDEPVVVAQSTQSPLEEEELLVTEDTFSQSRGKGVSFDSEPVDVRDLHRKVSELERESVAKDVKIGELDVRVHELENSNSDKDVKIAELQANAGGLTALYFDMQQKLIRRFGSEFKNKNTGDGDDNDSGGGDEAARD